MVNMPYLVAAPDDKQMLKKRVYEEISGADEEMVVYAYVMKNISY